MVTNYCIGKRTRYNEGDIVDAPPYSEQKTSTLYDCLRLETFKDFDNALIACELAEIYNPVGFVVLIIRLGDD